MFMFMFLPERLAAEERQRTKTESKKSQAEAQRKKGEAAARVQLEKVQTERSAAFAAARVGDAEKVKKGVWEDAIDAAGGEVKLGCHKFVHSLPVDPKEALLHIAARSGDADLVKWLDAHGRIFEPVRLPFTLTFLRQAPTRKKEILRG